MQNLQNNLEKNASQEPERQFHIQSGRDWYLVLGALGIFIIALFLHFWQLGKIPYPVFDEIWFGRYAEEYLEGKPTWEGHPPLGKYFIMIGILLFGHNEIGYRFLDASFGSIMPLLVIGLVYRLTYKRNFALLTGLFVSSDGLFLVESRLSLINIFLVGCGVTSQIFLIAGLENKGKLRTFLLCCAGLMLGATASVKWNGLGFSLLLFLLVMLVWAIAKFFPKNLERLGILAEIIKLHWWQYLFCFVAMPIAFYLVQWLPLFMLNPGGTALLNGWESIPNFGKLIVSVHQHILWWHSSDIVTSIDPEHPAHPYCSSAISWAVSARPVGYYFQNNDGYFSVIQGLGNPILWWFSTLAIVVTTITSFLSKFLPRFHKSTNGSNDYLLLGYFSNYAPWLIVKRCLFIYHYMSAAVFSFMALAWLVSQMLEQKGILRYLGYAIISAVVLSQIFFMPIWLGLPILSDDFYHRIWFMPEKISGFNWI
ncbi:phospholipid carrier-dependent glycosyltransferase [Phormidium tenue]|uniref:Polyprenol-phosphate-mannose--protein mannosyltransferase n=1 Tax=Phormidium tenue FACHB-1050 TaxID=2692857 RepID=A0ABR8C717_9CYAN|nr:phospholipid carrier-dependent glycosyltransferase [Phormidium tenue]MBD2316579.1 phospholipid carrier-dependent glycosyltransferase [Phormidium tenue FACHB-1050]